MPLTAALVGPMLVGLFVISQPGPIPLPNHTKRRGSGNPGLSDDTEEGGDVHRHSGRHDNKKPLLKQEGVDEEAVTCNQAHKQSRRRHHDRRGSSS